jgi:glutamate-ammonia-ligase adenylyltransferase
MGAAAGGPLRTNTGAALDALADGPRRGEIELLRRAWRLQQALTQVLKLALDDGADPALEPPRFQKLLAKTAGAPTFPALRTALADAQRGAHRAFRRIVSEEA